MPAVSELRIALTVDDFDTAVAFYRDALGLEQVEDWSSDDGRIVLLSAGRATLELMDESQAAHVDGIEVGRRVSGTVRFAVEVDDSEQVAERLKDRGATAMAEPVSTPWGDVNVRLQTPDGFQLTLFSSP